jgi:hypothetical protein
MYVKDGILKGFFTRGESMKTLLAVFSLCLCVSALNAALTITAGDIQWNETDGYYYEYTLTYADMASGSLKFQKDTESSTNVEVYSPLSQARYVEAAAGTRTAGFSYVFDFSGVQINLDGQINDVVIESAAIRDKFTLSNNSLGSESTTAVSKISFNGISFANFTAGATPVSGSQTFIGSETLQTTLRSDTFYYSCIFTSSKADPNGFDEHLNQWNPLGSISKDFFKVKIYLDLRAPWGTYAGGSGTAASPYLIATAAQLDAAGNYPYDWDNCFELISDIDMSGYSYENSLFASNLDPGGLFTGTMFNGHFNGNGHTISNLRITAPEIPFVGVFGYLQAEGTIENLVLEGVDVTGAAYTGGLCGVNVGHINNCTVVGRVQFQQYGGILAGHVEMAGTITDSRAYGDCFCNWDIAGVFTGINYGTITGCSAEGNVNALNGYSGGFASANAGIIQNCYARSNVHSNEKVGGFTSENVGSIINCYADGTVSTGLYEKIGGFAGSNDGTISHCYTACRLVLPYGFTGIAGGFCGADDSNTTYPDAEYTACFWDTQSTGTSDGVYDSGGESQPEGDPAGIMGLTSAMLKVGGLYTASGWDFVGETVNGTNDVWNIIENVTYPRFAYECIAPPAGDINGDCVFDLFDFAASAEGWLDCGILTPELCP